MSTYFNIASSKYKGKCYFCGKKYRRGSKLRKPKFVSGGNRMPNLQIHHIDCDPKNNDPRNLVKLCASCHEKIHRIYKYWANVQKNQESKIEDKNDIDILKIYDMANAQKGRVSKIKHRNEVPTSSKERVGK